MKKFLRFLSFLAVTALPVLAQVGQVGEVHVVVGKAIPVRVSGTPGETNNLAVHAFSAHGAYEVVAKGYFYDIRFSTVSPTQVRVDIAKGKDPAPVFSEVVTGTSPRQALLRAADLAVAKTNGLGLRGFFTARLAFVGEGSGKKEIYTSDLFVGEARRITHDRALMLSPRWAPDGSRLLYTSYFQSGFPDIFQIDLRSDRRTTFASFRGTNSGARFSSNGQQVVMVLSSSGTPEIFVGNTGGGQPSRRTRSDAVKSSPCWSPDGSEIVFAMEPGPQLYVIPAGGGAPRRLVTGFSYSAEPDWNPVNRNKIACTIRDGSRYQIAVYDFSRGTATKVSVAPFDAIEPCWLADGRHLVYTARDKATSVLCILDTETGNSRPITSNLPPIGPAMQASVWTP
jgi:TolB protein